MKKIRLTRGKLAFVDAIDFEYLCQFNWAANLYGEKWYAVRNGGKIFMHLEVAERAGIRAQTIDHKDGDGLNNSRNNLRGATRSQNSANRGPTKNNTSGYKGVYYNKSRGRIKRWVANIKVNGKHKTLGYFDRKIDAARAYNIAAVQYFGDFAYLNPIS